MIKRSQRVFSGVLVVATLLAYLPALRGGFVWDDNVYVTQNLTLRSLEGLWQIWFQIGAVPQYYPLVHTLFWVEYHLWGLHPAGYHAVNILLHAAAALLLWRVLTRLELPWASWVAMIFALHPVQAESVAWITERKNVLSAVFYFASALAYLRFAGPPESPLGPRRRWWYAAAVVLFVAALLSKTVTCSLPAALLLVCWWKKGALDRRDVFPLLPFFALGLALGLLTAWVEKYHVGAQGVEWALSLADRCLIAGHALWFYAGKLLWPARLTFIYPRWEIAANVWWQWLFPATALGVIIGLWVARRRIGRGPVAAVLFFAGTLGPALGFINVYPMRFSFVADHFQYLACVGLFVLGVGLVVQAAEAWRAAALVYGFAAVVLPGLSILTWRQCSMYADMETLWRTTLARNPDCWMAQNNLGTTLALQGKLNEAVVYLEQALQSKPDNPEALYTLANVLNVQGKPAEAIRHYELALRCDPNFYAAHLNLGVTLARQGKSAEAIPHLNRALQIYPNDAETSFYLGIALASQGKLNEAARCYEWALQSKPDYIDALNNLGGVLALQGKTNEAIACYEKALRLKPDLAETHYNLGEALAKCEKWDEAIQHYEWALKSKPDYVDALNSLGVALVKQMKLDQAAQCFARAIQLKPGRAEYHVYLGITLTAQGKSAEAMQQIDRALDLATAQGNAALAASIRARFLTQPTNAPQSQPQP